MAAEDTSGIDELKYARDNASKIESYRETFAHLMGVPKPLLVALFTFKGGVGKTTLTELLAQTLARIGFTVLVIDGDRQMNITTFFKENPADPQLPPDGEETAEDDEAAQILASLNDDTSSQQQEGILESLRGQGYDAVIPSIVGDPLDNSIDGVPITSDYLIGVERDGCDDIMSAMTRYKCAGPNESPDVRLRQVQQELYNGQNGTGKIYLLPGCEQLETLATDYSNPKSQYYRQSTSAFRRMAQHAAAQVGARFVLVDIGPSTDDINRTFATSCDIIQPCTAPEVFSWAGSVMQTVLVLPAWLKYWTERVEKDREARVGASSSLAAAAAAAGDEHDYNPRFPRIMPFIGMQYVFEKRDRKIQWSHSNMFRAFELPFIELKHMLAKNGLTDAAAAAAVLQEKELTGAIPLEAHWIEFLNSKVQDKLYSKRLDLILNKMMVKTSGAKPQVVVPLLRHARHMGMAHELGIALFDITEEAITDYYKDPEAGLPQRTRVQRLFKQARAEGVVLLARMLSLVAAYATLLAQHNNTAADVAARRGERDQGNRPRARQAAAAGAGSSRQHQQQHEAAAAAPPPPVLPSDGAAGQPRGAAAAGSSTPGRRKRAAAEAAATAIKRQSLDKP